MFRSTQTSFNNLRRSLKRSDSSPTFTNKSITTQFTKSTKSEHIKNKYTIPKINDSTSTSTTSTTIPNGVVQPVISFKSSSLMFSLYDCTILYSYYSLIFIR
ncbi:hypothetical protein BLOT_005517 [Blomia tropicalis]|nr:hypothetical protein BLOT_005517 [Blomia tropicalis]